MFIKLLPYIVPLSAAALVALFTAYYIWRRGGSETIVSVIILLSSAEWLFSYIMEIATVRLAVKVFWNQVQYVGSLVLLSGLLILSLQSMGYDRWITKRNIILWNIIPVSGLIFIFTNAWHGLVWPYHELITRRGIDWLDHPHGPAYNIYILYVYLVIVSISVLLIRTIFRRQSRYRQQAIMILFGIFFPFSVNVLQFDYLYPLNLTQMAFSVSVIPLTLGLLRLQFGDVLPVARTAVFDGMDDGVIVLNGQSRIIDINAAAAGLFAAAKKELVGEEIETVWPDGRFLSEMGLPVARAWLRPAGRLYQPDEKAAAGREVVFEQDGQSRIYDVRVSPLADWRGYIISQIVVLRDVTDRAQAERLIQRAKEELEAKVAERTAKLHQINVRLQHELIERRQAEAALRQAHDELEQRVVERTADLAQANTLLTHELTERERIESRLRTSLAEKEVLLKEIHHRVKNNLQVISSMLNLQTGHVNDLETLAIFQDSQNRVRSMALIHEKLYQSENLALVDFGEYIQNLAGYLARSYGQAGIQLRFETEPLQMGIDTAVPCGLILNELISNALKHAFPDDRLGRITISLHVQADDRVCLSVADDGIGLPSEMDIFNTSSLGLQLVHTLVSQLGGEIQINHAGGVQFNIIFPFKISERL